MGMYFQALFAMWVFGLASSYPSETVGMEWDKRVSNYSRFNEIKEECSSVLAEASDLPPDRTGIFTIEKELSFVNGDWKQDKGSAPLMPFQSNYSDTENHLPLNLASFWIKAVDPNQGSAKMVNVRGILQLAISVRGSIFYMFKTRKDFEIYPAFTLLTIRFEGVYLELKNSQERLLCMLGSTHLPARVENASNPWDWLNKSKFLSPSLLEDDKILLQLRYPSKLSLTTREIRGKLTNINQHSNARYFDEIGISSQLAADSNYEFNSESLVAKACDPYPDPDNFLSQDIDRNCTAIMQFMQGLVLDVFPNWQCNGTDAYCSKLGPFILDEEVHGTDGSFGSTKLILQNVRCIDSGIVKSGIANVSAVFRAVPPSQDEGLARERSGLDGLTLPAEGEWNSYTGQLCMVGCLWLGSIKTEDRACNSRICIYTPPSLSIKQRSAIVGNIFSIGDTKNSFYPLSFEFLLYARYLPWDVFNKMSYKYSKTKLARSMLDGDKPVWLGEQIVKSFFKYPSSKLGKTSNSYAFLSNDLSLDIWGNSKSLAKGHFVLEVIAIEEFVWARWDQRPYISVVSEDVLESQEGKFLKVAAHLQAEGIFSKLFVEGIYDPRVGRMYLIGCRDVRATWTALHDRGDLEDGFDCLVEVKVEYPPTNTRWFINPTVKLSVTSKRTEDDPLFFRQIKIQTLPILYRSQREEIISRKTVEGMLRILTPSVMIGCLLSQLLYIRKKTEVAPYISVLMLGIQAVDYVNPFVEGAEFFFERMISDSEDNQSKVLSQSRWSERIDYMVKMLVLIAFLLTFRLIHKVKKSRIWLLKRTPLQPWRVPNDKRVLLAIFSAIHAIGFLMMLIVHTVRTSSRSIQSSTYLGSKGNAHKHHEWERELLEYTDLVKDFFLLPQIVGNILWHVECKPLRKVYYIGVTVLRLLPHIYDYSRSPVFNPYTFQYEFANLDSHFYSKFGDIAIPVTSVVLAIVIFVQQSWNKLTLGQALRSTSSNITCLISRKYERLLSNTAEAELVCGVNSQDNGHTDANEEVS